MISGPPRRSLQPPRRGELSVYDGRTFFDSLRHCGEVNDAHGASLKKAEEVADNVRLLRAWRKWHAEQLEEALASMHGAVLARLMEELKDLRSARELVDFIAAQDWSAIDANTRFTALHEINNAITKLRERHGMEPIDDPLPGQPDNASRIIKRMFESFPSRAGKTTESVR